MEIVGRWMSSPAITVPETMVLPEARQLMEDRKIRRLPVVNNAGELVGIVTERDIIRISDVRSKDIREYNLRHRIATLPIGDIMSREVETVTPDTRIIEVAQLLLERRIGGVPVVEGRRVIGVITESDLFRLIIKQYAQDLA